MTFLAQFGRVVALDWEYQARPGERPDPVCFAALDVATGERWGFWHTDLPADPPFGVGTTTLVVGFSMIGDLDCFDRVGWLRPARVLDLYTAWRCERSGAPSDEGARHSHPSSLLAACEAYGVPAMTSTAKDAARGLVIARGPQGPWTPDERDDTLAYCLQDVAVTAALLAVMLPRITLTPVMLGQELMRGRYMLACSRIEAAGVPIDAPRLAALMAEWPRATVGLITRFDADTHVFEGTVFKAGRLASLVHHRGYDWPRLPSGALMTDRDTFGDMADLYPELRDLATLRGTLGVMHRLALAVGPDGRNRAWLNPFGTVTGRNAPSNSQWIFGAPRWLRGLIRPEPGGALAYIDWTSQEVFVAAVLSGDEVLLSAAQSGDPYMHLAVESGAAPAGGTKHTHPGVRAAYKVVMLAANYGAGAHRIALTTGVPRHDADAIIRRFRSTYRVYARWADRTASVADLTGRTTTAFGWPMRVHDATKHTTLLNWPIQANAAEHMRLAAILATERGITIAAPVHDAFAITTPVDTLDDAVSGMRAAMDDASRCLLGVVVPTTVTTVRYPHRFMDENGLDFWNDVAARTDQPRATWTRGAEDGEATDEAE